MANDLHTETVPEIQEFRTLVDVSPIGIGVADMRGNLLYYNAAMLSPGGWERVDIEKMKNVGNLYFDAQQRQKILGDAAKNGIVDGVEVKFRKKDGGFYPAQMSLKKIQFQGQDCWLAIVKDISEMSRSEQERVILISELEKNYKAMLNVLEDLDNEKLVAESERRKYLVILENIGDGVIVVNNDGITILMNKAAEVMLGYTLKDLLNKKYINIVEMENEKGEKILIKDRCLTNALEKRETMRSEYVCVRKNKTKFFIDIINTPIQLEKNVYGVVMVFRDITKQKEIDKAKSEFVSLASHQLRTPIGIAKWYLEAVKNDTYFKKFPATLREYVDEVYNNNERVLALVRDLLSVSRIDQGRVKDNPHNVDINELMESIVNEMKILAKKRNIKLELKVKIKQSTNIFIDAARLREVVENLIMNALQYNKPNGSVTVTLSKLKSDVIKITVQDTGIGIPVDDINKLFFKFFRSEKGTATNAEGSGLGLYVAKSYVTAWGGDISVESKVGEGSTFTVTLPNKFQKNEEVQEK